MFRLVGALFLSFFLCSLLPAIVRPSVAARSRLLVPATRTQPRRRCLLCFATAGPLISLSLSCTHARASRVLYAPCTYSRPVMTSNKACAVHSRAAAGFALGSALCLYLSIVQQQGRGRTLKIHSKVVQAVAHALSRRGTCSYWMLRTSSWAASQGCCSGHQPSSAARRHLLWSAHASRTPSQRDY